MEKIKEVICIIPARAGSKRIKNKNIINFYGKPIIAYPIIAAQKTKIFKKIFISTDSKKIANIAKKYGATVPFLRAKNISDDLTSTGDVLYNTIINFKTFNYKYHCCIYPATPTINYKTIIKAFKYFKKNNFDSLISVMEFSHPTTRLIKIKNEYIYFKNKRYLNQRSQDSDKEFHDAGCFYFFKTDKFLRERKLFLKKTGFFILKKYSHVDINTTEDLLLAKKLFIK